MRLATFYLLFLFLFSAHSQSYVDSGIRHFLAGEYDEALIDFDEADKMREMFTESSKAKLLYYRGLTWLELAKIGDFEEEV